MILDNIKDLIQITELSYVDKFRRLMLDHPIRSTGIGAVGSGIGGFALGRLTANPKLIPINNAIPDGLPTLLGAGALGVGGAYLLNKRHKEMTKNEK